MKEVVDDDVDKTTGSVEEKGSENRSGRNWIKTFRRSKKQIEEN